MLNLYFLSLPERQKRPDVLAVNQIKQLKKWLKDLPSSNPGMVTRLVYDRIREINRTEMEAKQLAQILDRLLPYYSTIHQFLTSHLLVDGLPLPANKGKIADLLLAILKEFCFSYSLLLNSDETKKNKRWMARVKLQLIHTYSDLLALHYLLRLEEPDWIWLDLNSLYKSALQDKIQTTKFTDPRLALKRKASIEETFIRILLLQMADPYSLTQAEIVYLYVMLEKWETLVKIKPYRSDANDRTQGWLVDLDKDKPPFWMDYSELTDPTENCFELDLQPLLRLFQDHEELADHNLGRFEMQPLDEEKGGLLPVCLLYYLQNHWSGACSDRPTKFDDHQEQLLSIGLKTIHRHFDPSNLTDETIIGEWLTTPVSGYELSCVFNRPGQIAIGSLVGFKPVENQGGTTNLGIVNRIRRKSHTDPIRFEIISLNGKTYPAGIQPVKSAKKLNVYQRALLYMDDAEGENKTMLVVESKNLKNGDVIRVMVQDIVYTIKLIHRRPIGLSCYLFECQRLKIKQAMPSQGFDFL